MGCLWMVPYFENCILKNAGTVLGIIYSKTISKKDEIMRHI